MAKAAAKKAAAGTYNSVHAVKNVVSNWNVIIYNILVLNST